MHRVNLGGDGHESAPGWYRLRNNDGFHLSGFCYRPARLSKRQMEKGALRLR
jgi:hypothetical protein